MSYLSSWWESRKTCPQSICNFKCRNGGLDTSKNSLIDWWSLLHIVFGMLYSIPIFYLKNSEALLICFCLSVLYEIVENTTLGVCIGEVICCSPHYRGDNFWNSVTDIIFNMIGFCIMVAIKTSI